MGHEQGTSPEHPGTPTRLLALPRPRPATPCRSLSGLGLNGSIPEEGWELPERLQTLVLTNNSISGR